MYVKVNIIQKSAKKLVTYGIIHLLTYISIFFSSTFRILKPIIEEKE